MEGFGIRVEDVGKKRFRVSEFAFRMKSRVLEFGFYLRGSNVSGSAEPNTGFGFRLLDSG